MRIAFRTFGCKANSVDTDILLAEARTRGFQIVKDTEIADAYIINSCTVTQRADRDTRNQILRFKKQNPNATIGVIGCYPQVSRDELLQLGGVDFVVGTSNKLKLFDYLVHLDTRSETIRDGVEDAAGFLSTTFSGSRHARSAIKIQDGCSLRCSYCIVPLARGKSISLPPQVVINQIDEAYRQGYGEVVLTGIHVGHYGRDVGTSFMDLVDTLLARATGPRLRLSTLDPNEITDSLISLLGNHPRLCPHLHIALQSGSNEILSRMHRAYKAEKFIEVTQKIRQQWPSTFIGVDVIVGFPGETASDFENTVSCLRQSAWAKLHVFAFSSRKNTKAATMPGKVESAEIVRRSEFLRKWSDQTLNDFMRSQVGNICNVLLERPSRKIPNHWQGHTENYLPTYSEIVPGTQSRQIIRSQISKVEMARAWTIPI